jgi:hypothetical protein
VCGSSRRLAESYIQELKDKGEIHKDSFSNGLIHQIPLIDQSHPPSLLSTTIKVKMLNVYWDICECGTMYCTKFNCVETAAQVQAQRRPAPGNGGGLNGLPGMELGRN